MRSFSGAVLLGAGLFTVGSMVACSTEASTMDLAKNRYVYTSPEYRAPRQAVETVFIERLVDKRVVPNLDSGPSSRVLFSDKDWERHVAVMLEEVLTQEVDQSQIYKGLSQGTAGKPKPTDIVIYPTLTEMYRLREGLVGNGNTGRRRTVAVTGLHLKVMGPANAEGLRPILLDKPFREMAATQPSLARAERGIGLAGQTVRALMSDVLAKLYESNSTVGTIPASSGKDGGKPSVEAPRQEKPGEVRSTDDTPKQAGKGK